MRTWKTYRWDYVQVADSAMVVGCGKKSRSNVKIVSSVILWFYTASSQQFAHPAECHPIFGNDGTLYYTRHLNCISNFTYRYFWCNTIVSLRQLLYCIFLWAYSLAAWLEINVLLTYLLTYLRWLAAELKVGSIIVRKVRTRHDYQWHVTVLCLQFCVCYRLLVSMAHGLQYLQFV